MPEGTCDCHFHVFAPHAPLASPRSYTPRIETLDGWLQLADAIGMAHGVLVQPSVYGFDNRVLLTALAAHAERLRGIVVIPPETDGDELMRLHRLGVRGVRINLRNKTGLPLEAVPTLASAIQHLGWQLQFQVGPDGVEAVTRTVLQYGITAVIDHAAFLPVADPAVEPGITALQRLLDTGSAYVKLSAPYRLAAAPDYPGFGALVARLAASHPERLLWGSDWPHTELFEAMPDDADLVSAMLDWLPDEPMRRKVFVTNPESLYWSTE
ncbi:amidohydrolase family protein [Devosia nitrariae]|uniref:GntR family transcriptional regulator n=1 Tax=Devosia nitrariae TaxID=2071872 RepID=A0ABQ5VZ27_9HYPH|nr:amidohydrolase family protein [Devosia nitrariae]GLQ53075.1 GntR family transcriptional regulator [Devosia nitrariae]